MPFLRRGFLKSASRPNNLYCRIDGSPIAAIFFVILYLFLGYLPLYYHHSGAGPDLAKSPHAQPELAAMREDAVQVVVTRDGAVYFRNSRVAIADLPNRIRDATLNGAEKKIYLVVDARALYRDVKSVLAQIQIAGIQRVCFLAY